MIAVRWESPSAAAEVVRLQQEREKLVRKLVGHPKNRATLASLTVEQLKLQVGKGVRP